MVGIEKYHGTGNDFVVVDAAEDVPHRRAFARDLCDREDGIEHPDGGTVGADGVLFLALEPAYNPPRVVMTLVQPDGSVAEMCGNGARCAARWAADRTGRDEVMIDTPSGTRHARIEGDREARSASFGATGERSDPGADVTIEMGTPTFDPAQVPLAGETELVRTEVEGLVVTAVNTGVPHAVAFVEDIDGAEGIDDVDLESVAPPVRHADAFPEGANVTVAEPVAGGFRQRTFERGVEGETRSCGTGAVAIAAVARRLDRIGDGETVTVSPPGGDLAVTLDGRASYLRGPVVREFGGQAAVPEPRRADASGD